MLKVSMFILVSGFAATIQLSSCGGMTPSGGKTSQSKSKVNDCNTNANATKTASLALLADVTYEKDIKGMVNAKCAWCHSATAAANVRETPYLTSFATVKSRYTSSMEQINQNEMPPSNVSPQLDPGDKALLQAWAAGGFLEGEPPAPVDITKGVFYEDAIKPMLTAQCTGCHKTGGQSPALDTYATAKSGASSSWIDIEKNSMPKAGPLSAADRAMFKTWMDNGMPFNAANDPAPVDPVVIPAQVETASPQGTPSTADQTAVQDPATTSNSTGKCL